MVRADCPLENECVATDEQDVLLLMSEVFATDEQDALLLMSNFWMEFGQFANKYA